LGHHPSFWDAWASREEREAVHRLALSAVCAYGTLAVASAVSAVEVNFVAPLIPPHFQEDGGGRIGDVIKAVLLECGHSARFTMVPFGRHWKEYEDGPSFTALATAEADQTFAGFSTAPFMRLQDGATVLAGGRYGGITAVPELHGASVVAFPNARTILGIEGEVARFASYVERSNRFDQLRPLFAGRTDAILADGLITAHFVGVMRQHAAEGKEVDIDPAKPLVFRRIFAAGPQRLYFREAPLARDFDRCFRVLLDRGDVARIAKPHVDRYRAIVGDQYPDY
jgi:polar amino acid transport system substrate-binding protein